VATSQPYLAHLAGVFLAPVQAWSGADGQMAHGAEGIYCADDRVFSRAELATPDNELRHLSTQVRSATAVDFHYAVVVPAQVPDPLVTLIRERRASTSGVEETIRVHSALGRAVSLSLVLTLTADNTAMEQVKAGRTTQQPPVPGGPMWSWRDADTRVKVEAGDATVETDGSDLLVQWRLDVPADGVVEARWTARMSDAAAPVVAGGGRPLEAPRIGGADHRLHTLMERAFSDLNSLRIADASLPQEVFLAAGAPWFYTMFGRDALIAARMLLPVETGLAAGTLRALAARQGTRTDPETAEQPGKILHEVRRTSLSVDSAGGVRLPPVYYGTIDATPLWIALLHDAWKAGMPDAEVEALLPNLEAALTWLGEHGDSDGDGFLEYLDTSGHGLANQGWKDSGDSIRWHDGSLAEGPIALCEVQGYAFEAATAGAALLEAFGRPGAQRWHDLAAELADRFRAAFWCEDDRGRFPAIALDGRKRPVDSVTSNIGHLLGTGLLDAAEEAVVVERLMSPEMFSGYGIRTISTDNGGYWPLRYHAGSVWSHDTAMVLMGMTRAGFADEAARLADALIEAAVGFDYRLPELFSGHGADEVRPPVPYPASCRPQAWAAASVVPIAIAVGALRV
jgi:hypothetical protein